jgi:hypothetical protein
MIGQDVNMTSRNNYSPGDMQLFDELMRFAVAAAERWPENVEPEAAGPSAGVDYTDGDLHEFRELMSADDDCGTVGHAPGLRRGRPAFGLSYSETDCRQFDELVRIEPIDLRRPGSAGESSSVPPSPSIEYSRADLEQFRQLAGEAQDERQPAPLEGGNAHAKADRDVGHIKIIDFDKRHARSHKIRQQGNVHMKIRFFD